MAGWQALAGWSGQQISAGRNQPAQIAEQARAEGSGLDGDLNKH